MQEFTEINNKIKEFIETGEEEKGEYIYLNEWLPLNTKMIGLENNIQNWGIELSDPRLVTMLKDIKPSLFFNHEEEGIDECTMKNLKSYANYRSINEGTWAYTQKDTEEMINALNAIKNPNEINDEFYKVWWNKVGDDQLYDELDKAKKEPQNWQSYIMVAIERLKWLLENVKDLRSNQNDNVQ